MEWVGERVPVVAAVVVGGSRETNEERRSASVTPRGHQRPLESQARRTGLGMLRNHVDAPPSKTRCCNLEKTDTLDRTQYTDRKPR